MDVRFYLFVSVTGLLLISCGAYSDEIVFDSSAIENTSQTTASKIDLSQFSGSAHPEGKYYVAIRVNNTPVARKNVNFIQNKQGELIPDLSVAELHAFGVYFSDKKIDTDDTYKISDSLPWISTKFNFNKQLLDINIPQAALKESPDSDLSVPPAQWDEGINALSLNYDISGAQQKEQGESFKPEDQYMRLNGGVNLGAWRLRSVGSFNKPSDGTTTWNNEKLWVQRDIPALRSLLMAGDGNSDGTLFDSIDYTGISLATKNTMYSDKAQGYAPVIRGIARTSNAKVEISQNGNVIYQRYVPAGAFAIDDLFSQSGGGELKVTITEADGSQHYFTQPWGMVSAMQRDGHLRYSVNMGRSNNGNSDNENFSQLTFFYGLPAEMTVFGGTFLAENYHALDLGYAFGLDSFGSVSADVTAMTAHKGETAQGQNYRLQYSKNLASSDTDMSLSWSFAPTEQYISFPDAIMHLDSEDDQPSYQKNKLQVSINQPVGDINMFVLSAWRAEYWHQDTEKSLSLTDNFSIDEMSLSLGWAWTQNDNNDSEQQFSANLMIPFSAFDRDAWVSLTSNLQRPGKPSQSVGINGNALANDSLSWSLNATQGDTDTTEQDVDLDYKGAHGEYSANYSHATPRQSLSYHVKGSFIASAYGLTAGQFFNTDDAVALVKAAHVSGLPIKNNTNVVTDYRGYAIVPYLQPYRQDSVMLDSAASTESNIELGNTNVTTVPTEGAIVIATFSPHVGEKLLVTLHSPDGASLPFGTTATVGDAVNEGIVDENGQVYLSGVPAEGVISASEGNATHECHAPYKVKTRPGKHLYELQLVCQ